ncbi:MAG: dephospho-CoA kinase [Spirochaetia bacterium]|jgi:dephospho-CoA kinase|nr:dephospho-CoA kinase [Spirochaetia bacterium]
MGTIIGLTGGYCAGKNEAALCIQELGFRVIDVDTLGHRALEAKTDALVQAFGSGILNSQGGIDRKALGAIVFADPETLGRHEAIVHPAMLELLDEELMLSPKPCINAALLYRFPQLSRCDLVIEIQAPLLVRYRRARSRDGLSLPAFLKRIARQRPLWKLRPLGKPPVVFIQNTKDRLALKLAITETLAEFGI